MIIGEKIFIARNDGGDLDESKSIFSSEGYSISTLFSPIPIDEDLLNHRQCKGFLLFGFCPDGQKLVSSAFLSHATDSHKFNLPLIA
jgi:hypothetical protein